MAAKRKKRPASPPAKGNPKRQDKKPAPVKSERPRVTGWRLWLFRFVAAIVMPVLLLVGVEVALRITNYGYPAAAIATVKIDGTTYGCDNAQFSRRFFPRHLAREAVPYIFPAAKPDDTCRIFVLGASAAMGVPEPMFSFGRMLNVMLTDRYPGVHFEVITTAMAAINSHAVLPIAQDAAHYDPDLFVVYLGNNEVTGPYGAGTVFAPLADNLRVIRAAIAFKATRLGQLMTNLLNASGKDSAPKVWRGLEMFRDRQIRTDDAALEVVYQHFQRNLEDIVRTGQHAGAAVVLCTVAANLKDNPPFASLHRPNLSEAERQQWDTTYAQGITHEQAGQYAKAVEAYLTAADIDDSYADLQFRLGRCFWALQQYADAADRYTRARELDTLRFRADNRINAVIRQVAQQKNSDVYLTDTVNAVAQHSPGQTPGEELFYEHVHLNFSGNYLVAQAILTQVERALPERVKKRRTGNVTPLSEAECAGRLAYTIWDRTKIADKVLNNFMRRLPFSGRLYHDGMISHLEIELASLKGQITPPAIQQAIAVNRAAIDNAPRTIGCSAGNTASCSARPCRPIGRRSNNSAGCVTGCPIRGSATRVSRQLSTPWATWTKRWPNTTRRFRFSRPWGGPTSIWDRAISAKAMSTKPQSTTPRPCAGSQTVCLLTPAWRGFSLTRANSTGPPRFVARGWSSAPTARACTAAWARCWPGRVKRRRPSRNSAPPWQSIPISNPSPIPWSC